MEGLVLAMGSLPAPSSLKTQTPDSEARQLYLGREGGREDTWHFWVWALHAAGSRDDMSLLPKALRGSQTPERGAQPLPSSVTQPFVAPGALGISAKPLERSIFSYRSFQSPLL